MEHFFYIAKQPIFNASGVQVYQELFYRENSAHTPGESNTKNTAALLLSVVNYLGVKSAAGTQPWFVNINDELIVDQNFLEAISCEDFVLEIKGDIEATPAVRSAIQNLKQAGYKLALNEFICNETIYARQKPFLEYIDFLKIDLQTCKNGQLKELLSTCNPARITMIATHIQNAQEFEAARAAGFTYFQGFFFQKPKLERYTSLNPSVKGVFELEHLLEKDAPIEQIVEAFSNQADLALNMLQYINSAAISSRERIESIRHAINLLGRKTLKNWLLLFLYAQTTTNPYALSLLESALFRAKLMQLLALAAYGKPYEDKAFMTGVISCLDALFKISMEQLLKHSRFDEEVQEALTGHTNKLGRLLELTVTAEHGQFDKIIDLLLEMDLGMNHFIQALRDAYIWTDERIKQLRQ